MKPLLGATTISVEASDEQLVESAQLGNSEAFAALFRRYRPAVARYAGRILGDDVRAEDIVQEVFLSALRSIDTLDRPGGFKPWLYRIAHNTCVDQMRRTRRGEEVSMDASVLAPSEEIRLFRQAPSTHAAVTLKEDFKHLREAFSGLPPAQSEVLILRELQGLSYEEIALRLGVSRASVESTLFRARQGLRAEYGEIATGERCLRMRPVMARMAEGIGGLRDKRALVRHVRGCHTCRREAYAMGLGGTALESVTGMRGKLSRVAALLPLPWLIHRRADETEAASSASGGGSSLVIHAQTTVAQLSATMGVGADQAATAIHKAVAVVAAVAVVGGGGLVASKSGVTVPARAERPAAPHAAPAADVPRALLPVKSGLHAVTDPAVVAAAPSAPASAPASAPLLPTAPSGVPGPIDTLGVPDAVAPGEEEFSSAGEPEPAAEALENTPATEPSVPAASDTGGSSAPAPDGAPTDGAAPGDGVIGDAGQTPSEGGTPPSSDPSQPPVCESPPSGANCQALQSSGAGDQTPAAESS